MAKANSENLNSLTRFRSFSEQQTLNPSLKIQDVRQKIMEPCRDQYINSSARSLEEKEDDMMDCLILRSNDTLNETTSLTAMSFPERIQSQKKLPLRFGLRPPSKKEQLRNWLGPISRLEIQIHANDNNYSGHIEFDTALHLQKSTDKALFLQPGWTLSVRNKQAVVGSEDNFFQANMGLVYRFVLQDGILGFNLFYDRSWSLEDRFLQHSRLSTGIDYQNNYNQIGFNYYYPLEEDWKDINELYQERQVEGADFYLKQILNERWESSMGISAWDYKDEEDRVAFHFGMDYKIDCERSLSLALERDFTTHKTRFSAQYNMVLGLPESYKGEDCLQELYEGARQGQLYRLVERQKAFRLEHRRKPLMANKDFSQTPVDQDSENTSSNRELSSMNTLVNLATDSSQNPLAPILIAQNQVVQQGEQLSFSPSISNLDSDEGFIVNVHPIFSDTSPLVSYSQQTNQFHINAHNAELGEFLILGHIQGEDHQFNYWFFLVTVVLEDSETPSQDLVEEEPSYSTDPPFQQRDPNEDPDRPSQESPDEDSDSTNSEEENPSQNEDPDSNEEPENPQDPPEDPPEDPEDSEESETAILSLEREPPDNQAPVLSTQIQSIRKGKQLSYQPVISNLRANEAFTVTINSQTRTGAPAVSWNADSDSFLISARDPFVVVNSYSFSGNIRDENGNSSSWSLIVRVTPALVTVAPLPPADSQGSDPNEETPEEETPPGEETPLEETPSEEETPEEETPEVVNQPPSLTAQNQVVKQGQAITHSPIISNLREGESYSVSFNNPASVDVRAPTIVWDHTNQRFRISAIIDARLAEYSISGTIQTANHSSSWSFIVRVTDGIPPLLTAQTQSLKQGQSRTNSPVISNLRAGESYTVTVNNPASGPTVAWDHINKRFHIRASDIIGQYRISGTIKDANNNSSSWSFNVRVTDGQAPLLITQTQWVKQGQSITVSPIIRGLRSGESYEVSINNPASGAPAVTWDYTNKRFLVNAQSAQRGFFDFSGTIQDANENSRSWSWTIVVADPF